MSAVVMVVNIWIYILFKTSTAAGSASHLEGSDARKTYKWQNAVFLQSMQLDRRFNVRRHEKRLFDTQYRVYAPLKL
jgi:hypothetical protein